MASYMETLGGKAFWVWLVYGFICAVIIASTNPQRRLIHALMTGLIVGGTLWLAFVARFTPHYPSGVGGFELFSIRLLSPVAGMCGGLALMLLTWLAAFLVGNRR
jgi:hypothetical protein